jgi:hypothetical protein
MCKFTGTITWSINGLVIRLKELDISENNFDTELSAPIDRLGNVIQLAKVQASRGAHRRNQVTAGSLLSSICSMPSLVLSLKNLQNWKLLWPFPWKGTNYQAICRIG